MEEYEHDDLMGFERDEEHLPFIDELDDFDEPDDDYEDDLYEDIASFRSYSGSQEDTSPRLAEETE